MSELATRRQEEKDRRREEILDAAAETAAQYGMAVFTMDQVARKARLSRALLYVYFTDKHDLLLGLADRANANLQQRFAAINARRLNGLNKIQHMGRAYVAFAEEDPVYFEAMSHYVAHFADGEKPQGNELRCMEGGSKVHDEIITALEVGRKDGSIRRELSNAMLVSFTLWAFMHGVVQLISTKGEAFQFFGIEPEQLIEQALSLCTRSLQKE